ncbi:hypothetical protein EVAR_100072_1 [Eumeta japonica]|uniref:Uncharacterized protein n=1 Tax=Eumeta variegata TaxID=151549 RepID=A0A4C1Z0S1_EUMVA|nr:hypothetical protein EVAR_100072_1 [Eumeta japonica]
MVRVNFIEVTRKLQYEVPASGLASNFRPLITDVPISSRQPLNLTKHAYYLLLPQPSRTCYQYSFGGRVLRRAAALRVADSLPSPEIEVARNWVEVEVALCPLGQLGANLISSIARSIARRCDHETSTVEIPSLPIVVALRRSSRCL